MTKESINIRHQCYGSKWMKTINILIHVENSTYFLNAKQLKFEKKKYYMPKWILIIQQ